MQKYFSSIDHPILLRQLERDIRCARTLEVCRLVLEAGLQGIRSNPLHFPGDDLFAPHRRAVGLPIGNLTSQHFANRYLSPVDHRAKDRLQIRGYLRYMDDMLVFGDDREQLRGWGRQLEEACWRQRLRLHPWQVRPCADGAGWLGFRLFPGLVRVKSVAVRRALRRLQALQAHAHQSPEAHALFWASLQASLAHFQHADSWRLRSLLLRRLGLLHE